MLIFRVRPNLNLRLKLACLQKDFPFNTTIHAVDFFVDSIWRCNRGVKFYDDYIRMFLAELGKDNAFFPENLYLKTLLSGKNAERQF